MNIVAEIKLEQAEIKNISYNLKRLMKSAGITESELSRVLKIPVMTVRRIVSGETVDPRISTLKLFSDYFKISIDQLIAEKKLSEAFYPVSDLQPSFVPVLEWRQVQNGEIFSSIDKMKWSHWHPVSMDSNLKLSSNSFAMQTKATMQPRFPNGTLLIIDMDESPLDGDLVLVRFENNEISLREYVIDSPNIVLYPVIIGSETVKFEKARHKVIGVVVLTLMYPRKKIN